MMNDILSKIDTLIEMSKSTSKYDALKAELQDIQADIENKKREIEDLRLSMQDEKYIKASDRIIDENIKVSLELKIQKLEANVKDATKELKKMVEEEESAHQTVQNWKEKVTKISKLLEILKSKSKTTNDSETQSYYENLITENTDKLNDAKRNVTETLEKYNKISRELTDFTNALNELKEQLKDEKAKLASTMKSLENNDSYIDFTKKENDEKRLESLKKKLEELKMRQEEILKDAVYIGNVAKELYIEDDRTGCIIKIKELVDYLKTLPFMDIPNSADVERILNESEETAIRERDEFASFIDNKSYDESNTGIIEERKHYLEGKKQSLQVELENVQEKIKNIDLEKVKEINALLSAAMIVSSSLRSDLEEYRLIIESEKENATPKKRAVLSSAYKKKEEELKCIESIISAYETEMEELMVESKQLEETTIPELMRKIEELDHLLKDISKKTLVASSSSDVLSLENDKAKLKELNNQIKIIAERRKYNETPSEIYDFIEMSLGSLIEESIEEEREEENVDNFRITEDIDFSENLNRTEKNKDILTSEPESIPDAFEETFDIPLNEEENMESNMWSEPLEPSPSVLESIPPVETSTNIEPTIESPSVLDSTPPEPTITSIEEIKPNTPTIQEMNTPVKERFKVIHIEDLNEDSPKDEVKDDDILIGDFKDDDYIDFDSIMGGSK